jgi:N6-adenosine-specific RNA methylase IME4
MKKTPIIAISQSREIIESHLAEIRAALIQAESLPDIKAIVDKTAILANAAKTANLGFEVVNQVQEIRLDAEIKLGHVIIGLKGNGELKAGGDRQSIVVANDNAFNLADYGITRDLSSRSQALAKSEKRVKADAAEILKKGKELSILAIFDYLRGLDKRKEKDRVVQKLRTQPLPDPDGTFDVIVIDPPWKYNYRAEDYTHRARLQYPDMTLEEIMALPIGIHANENCILWLWATNAFLRDAFALVEHWEFEFKTILTWAKDKMGMGDWLRGKTEHCLFAIRGKPVVVLTNQTTLLPAPSREYSRKPDEFFALVDALCPGTKLEMFARETRPGWRAWGAETTKFQEAGNGA